MTTLRVSFAKALHELDLDVALDIIDARRSSIIEFVVNVARGISIDLLPDHYTVRVWYPSGEVFSSCVLLSEETASVLLDAPALRQELVPISVLKRAVIESTIEDAWSAADNEKDLIPCGLRIWAQERGSWICLAAREVKTVGGSTSGSPRMVAETSVNLGNEPLWMEISLGGARRQYVAMSGQLPGLRILLGNTRTDQRHIAPTVLPLDVGAIAALAYLTSGNMGVAHRLSTAWREQNKLAVLLNQDKISEAVACGYLFIKTQNFEALGPVTTEIAGSHAWSADLAILHAYRLLHASDASYDDALTWLLEAAERGIPQFQEGLRLLVDGLSIFEQSGLKPLGRQRPGGRESRTISALREARSYLIAQSNQTIAVAFFADDPANPSNMSSVVTTDAETLRRELEGATFLVLPSWRAINAVERPWTLSARKLQQRALRLRRELGGAKHPDSIEALRAVAGTYQAAKELGTAETLYALALRWSIEKSGRASMAAAHGLFDLAQLHMEAGRQSEAEKVIQEALLIVREHQDSSSAELARLLQLLARIHYHNGRYLEAEQLQRTIIELQMSYWGLSFEALDTMHDLSETLLATGRQQYALDLKVKLLELAATSPMASHPNVLRYLSSVARLLNDTGQNAEAEKIYRQVYLLSLALLGEDHPETSRYSNALSVEWVSLIEPDLKVERQVALSETSISRALTTASLMFKA